MDIKVKFDSEEDIKTSIDTGSIQYGQLEIGTTKTGEAGTQAVVTNSGSSSHAILNFTIPKGDRGEKGAKGDKGDTPDLSNYYNKAEVETKLETNKTEVEEALATAKAETDAKLDEKADVENSVVVSATEPTTEEKVWFKQSKNLFNANANYDYSTNTHQINYSIVNANKIKVTNAGVWNRLGCTIPNLKPNTKYTVSTDITNSAGLICGLFSTEGEYTQTATSFKAVYTFTTDASGNLSFQFYANKSGNNSTDVVVFDNIQVELGTTPTEYEAFNKKAIYVKEDGTYEEYIKPQVKVSSTEPTNEDVWFKKGKNLFDIKQLSMVANCVANSDGTFTSNIQGAYYCYVILTYLNDFILKNKGKTLTLSMNLPNENYIGIIIYGTRTSGTNYQELLAKADHCSLKIADDFTSISRLEIRFNRQNSIFTDTTTVVSEIQLELSDTPTSYEPYIDKEIYVKNANGVFEKFANVEESEIDIGPLLRNGWELHQNSHCLKRGDIVHLHLNIKKGTATTILVLPEGFRPIKTIQLPIVAIGLSGILYITPDGVVSCIDNMVNYTNSALYINGTFKV